MLKFEGIIPANITPYDKSGEIDKEKFRELFDFLIDGGIHGLWLIGTTGDGPLLNLEEKKKAIDIAIEHIDGRIPVIAGAGCTSTKDSIETGKYAEEAGADAIHIVMPYYYPVSNRGLKNHFEKIAASVKIPIFIYHIPQHSGYKLDIDTLLELVKIPNILGVKDSSQDIGWFYKAITKVHERREDFIFFTGTNHLIYTSLNLGAHGAVPSVANIFPELFVNLYEEYRSGNHEKAKEIQDKISKITEAVNRGPYMSGIKAGLKLLGKDFGYMREPLTYMNDEEMKKLERNLKELDVI